MGSCGCSGGMKNGRPCGCASCNRKYNHSPAMKIRAQKSDRFRRIDGKTFMMWNNAGKNNSGPYLPKREMLRRAAVLRANGFNARVIPLSKGHTLWIAPSVRKLMNQNKRIEFGFPVTPKVSKKGERSRAAMMATMSRRYDRKGKGGVWRIGIDEWERANPDVEYFEVNYSGNLPTPLNPRLSISAGKAAKDRYWEMLETFVPAYWMSNSKHTDLMDGWVMHNDADDPLYETQEGSLVNTSEPSIENLGEGASMVVGSFDEAVGALWDSEKMEIAADAPDWVGSEYIKHMPTGRIITRQQLADGEFGDMFGTLGQPNTQRFRVNTYEADIAGGRSPDDTDTLPANSELYDYMKQMPDNFHTFLMPELDNHTLKGDMITTQYARLGDDSPAATYVSKKVVVGDPATWIQNNELGKSSGQLRFNGKRKDKTYNHLQWWSPGTIKIKDINKNGIHDGVEKE
jgi:hypothetical protein